MRAIDVDLTFDDGDSMRFDDIKSLTIEPGRISVEEGKFIHHTYSEVTLIQLIHKTKDQP